MTAPELAGGSDDPPFSDAGLADAGIATPPGPAGGSSPRTAGWAARPVNGALADPGLPWRRLSRRSMIVRPLTDLVRLLPLVAGLLILHTKTGSGLAWGVAASVIAVITGLVHWATTRYLITEERVYLRRGLLNQKTLSVARDRIRTVDVTAHLLHRVLGVCKVSIGTGRNDLKSGESFHLDGITRSEAESLRIELLSGVAPRVAQAADRPGLKSVAQPGPVQDLQRRLRAGPQAGAAQDPHARARAETGPSERPTRTWTRTERTTEILRLQLSWLRFAPLTLTGVVVLGVLFGAVIQITNATEINIAATDPVQRIVTDFTALSVVERILAGGSVLLLCYVFIAMVGYIAVFWNFQLVSLGGDALRVTRGLLSVRATTISLARLRGVEISESLLLRAARGARCIAIATGLHVGRGAEREGSVLSPPAPRAVALHVAMAVLGLPEDLCAGPLIRHGPAARRRRYVRALAGAVGVIAFIYLATRAQDGPTWVWVSSFALLPVAALLAADRYRSLGHRLAGGWLVTRTGTLARRRNIISTDAIIGWRVHQTWFQRRQGLITLTATTAAGQQHYSVRDVPVDAGLALATAATGQLLQPFLRASAIQDLRGAEQDAHATVACRWHPPGPYARASPCPVASLPSPVRRGRRSPGRLARQDCQALLRRRHPAAACRSAPGLGLGLRQADLGEPVALLVAGRRNVAGRLPAWRRAWPAPARGARRGRRPCTPRGRCPAGAPG
jgi:putative membrane protein